MTPHRSIALSLLFCTFVQPVAAHAQTATPAETAQKLIAQAKADADQIEKGCGYSPTERNKKKIRKANACMAQAIRARQQSMSLDQSVHATVRAQALRAYNATDTDAKTKKAVNDAVSTQSGVNPGESSTDNGSANNFYGGSLSGTPSTCGKGAGAGTATAINDTNLIRVHRSILTPQTAQDDFGVRLGRQFIVYQVTVENGSKEYQFMLQDVTIDFSGNIDPSVAAGFYKYSASGQDLTLLRGVPEVGNDLDKRNFWYHLMQGVGSVAGAVSGLTSFADVMGPSVAIFNGSFQQGYTTLLPDHSATQLNRLSDSAFIANTVINKQSAKTIAMFIPADEILSKSQQKDFRSDPNLYLGFAANESLLNDADVCVDGTFIQAVAVTAPTLTSATLAKSPTPTAGQPAILNIAATNLVAGDTQVILSGATPASFPVIVAADGSGSAQVTLPTDYDPAKTTAMLQSKSNPTLKSKAITMTLAN